MSVIDCKKLLAREFWLDGEQVDACCVFYILYENGDHLRASWNDVHCIWEVVGTNEKIDISSPLGDGDFFYPYTEYNRSDGKPVGGLTRYQVDGRTVLTIEFSSNLTVTLKYDESTDNGSVLLSA